MIVHNVPTCHCDRCGFNTNAIEIEYNGPNGVKKKWVIPKDWSHMNVQLNGKSSMKYDLCHNCTDDLKKWSKDGVS